MLFGLFDLFVIHSTPGILSLLWWGCCCPLFVCFFFFFWRRNDKGGLMTFLHLIILYFKLMLLGNFLKNWTCLPLDDCRFLTSFLEVLVLCWSGKYGVLTIMPLSILMVDVVILAFKRIYGVTVGICYSFLQSNQNLIGIFCEALRVHCYYFMVEDSTT